MSERKEGMRNIYALGFVSFFTDVSILGLPGSSMALLGLIEGTAEAISYGLRAVSGLFSDKFRKRKMVVLAGYTLSTMVKPLFGIARTALDAFVIRVSDRVGKGVRTAPRDALISESVSGDRRGAAFGLHRTLDQLGAILGPVIASTAMVALGFTVRNVFWLSFIPGSIALLIIVFFVRERMGEAEGEFQLLKGLRDVLTGRFSHLLLIVGIFSFGAFNFSFILLNAQEFGVGDSLIPIVYTVLNIAHTAIAIPAGVLSDRIGKEKVLLMGYGVFTTANLLILISPQTMAAAYLIAVIYGLYIGIVETVQRALVPGYSEPELRGTAYGIYYLVVGAAFFVANAVVGALWESYGASAASLYCMGSAMLSILTMSLFLRTRKRRARLR
ncbi:hypothetical protein AC482_02455 [miscellaneous Crenarchaeota group-15 archaeon DG-45]|uniref:Major facilitator superfamily (MFS) profile domain-containing protein n=1 Tax=miscellaneous Crenarchaeota group-15 archaeon DG-45 TaxID=1685127 RepID=A0A0M0BRY3_9ARCH|nr:MAG: hypothetical protein AC482_02455 [miscellaneous Crenarchaeota group-15 archaeon DG-45]